MPDTLAQITELVEPSLRQCGVELYDAQWTGASGRGILRLVIDKETGVTLGDCERVSQAVGAVLDAYDPIAGRYSLEISSPGAERPLRDHRDWERAVGRTVHVRFRSGEAEGSVQGRLLAVAVGAVEVETRAGRRLGVTTIPTAAIVKAHVVAEIGR